MSRTSVGVSAPRIPAGSGGPSHLPTSRGGRRNADAFRAPRKPRYGAVSPSRSPPRVPSPARHLARPCLGLTVQCGPASTKSLVHPADGHSTGRPGNAGAPRRPRVRHERTTARARRVRTGGASPSGLIRAATPLVPVPVARRERGVQRAPGLPAQRSTRPGRPGHMPRRADRAARDAADPAGRAGRPGTPVRRCTRRRIRPGRRRPDQVSRRRRVPGGAARRRRRPPPSNWPLDRSGAVG